MKKRALVLLASMVFIFSSASFVFAQGDLTQQIANKSGYGQADNFTLSQTVGKIIKVVLGLLGTVFLVLTIYAGFLWMTSGGNEEQAGKAIGILKTAVIGLIIILASYSITYFVLSKIFEATV